MINIESVADLAKHAIRYKVTAIINYYQTVDKDDFIFSYNKYYNAFSAIVFISVIFIKQFLLQQALL